MSTSRSRPAPDHDPLAGPARSARSSHRLGLALTVGTAAFLVLGAGALGIIGDGTADRAYLVVLAVLAVGSALARLRAAGMTRALLATALAQVLVPVVLLAGRAEGTERASLLDVAGLTVMYAGLFTLAAWLFHRAAALGAARPAATGRTA